MFPTEDYSLVLGPQVLGLLYEYGPKILHIIHDNMNNMFYLFGKLNRQRNKWQHSCFPVIVEFIQ